MKTDLIYGLHPLLEALEEGKGLEKIFLKKELNSPQVRQIKQLAAAAGTPVQLVPQAKLDRLLPGRTHQGAAAITSAVIYMALQELIDRIYLKGETPLLLLLDQLTDVRNVGAIFRSAECMGVHGVIVPAKGGAPLGGDALKTSAGALNRVTASRTDTSYDAVRILQQNGIHVVGVTEKARTPLHRLDLARPLCLVVGAEDTGITAPVLESADEAACIPMTGKLASLNVSVAAGMALYETMRQRTQLGG